MQSYNHDDFIKYHSYPSTKMSSQLSVLYLILETSLKSKLSKQKDDIFFQMRVLFVVFTASGM